MHVCVLSQDSLFPSSPCQSSLRKGQRLLGVLGPGAGLGKSGSVTPSQQPPHVFTGSVDTHGVLAWPPAWAPLQAGTCPDFPVPSKPRSRSSTPENPTAAGPCLRLQQPVVNLPKLEIISHCWLQRAVCSVQLTQSAPLGASPRGAVGTTRTGLLATIWPILRLRQKVRGLHLLGQQGLLLVSLVLGSIPKNPVCTHQ